MTNFNYTSMNRFFNLNINYLKEYIACKDALNFRLSIYSAEHYKTKKNGAIFSKTILERILKIESEIYIDS